MSISKHNPRKFPQVTTKFTLKAFRHLNKSFPNSATVQTVHFRHKCLTYPMLRESGCCLGNWFHSPLHFLSFSPRFANWFASSPKSWGKKTNHFRLQISPVTPPTVLLSSQISCCTPACLPSFVRSFPRRTTTDISSLCVITHRESFGSVLRARQTEVCR